jgi:hypothetical protein
MRLSDSHHMAFRSNVYVHALHIVKRLGRLYIVVRPTIVSVFGCLCVCVCVCVYVCLAEEGGGVWEGERGK